MKNERMKLVGTGEFPPGQGQLPESSGQPLQGQLVCSLLTAACVFSSPPETAACLALTLFVVSTD